MLASWSWKAKRRRIPMVWVADDAAMLLDIMRQTGNVDEYVKL